MKRRAQQSATADLFAVPDAAAQPAPASAAAPPPTRRSRAAPGSRHLWYAAVFTALERPPCTAALLRRLCLHAQQFTPWVSIEMPNALLLEIKGSVQLFGSLKTLHADIDARWSALKLCAWSASAPSALAALWLARAGERVIIEDPGSLAGRLADLPLDCTAWDAARLHTLRNLGVTRIGDLLRLPRAGLTRRFGAGVVLDLDIALGRQAAPRRAFVAPERFRERCDLEAEADCTAQVRQALGPLVERCARFLRRRQAGVQYLELRLSHRHEPVTRVRLGLASITSEYRRLADVADQKLPRLELVAPVRSLELRSGPLQPLSADSLDAFAALGGADGRDTAPQLVERLRARLGERAVYGICAVSEHRPEAAWRRVHALRMEAVPPERPRREAPETPRPVWLLEEPVELPPPQLERVRPGRTMLEEGPERIESGWWDGKDVARDYYIARQTGGIRLWIFQERRSRCWYVHGVFA